MTLPPCSCGAATLGPAGRHTLSCDLVKHALGRGASSATSATTSPVDRATGRDVDGADRLSQKTRPAAERIEGREIGFRSKLERDMLLELWHQADASDPRALVIREPMLDLWGLWSPGMGTPMRWRPDALVLTPLVLERPPDVLRGVPDPLGPCMGGGAQPVAWQPAIHEAKSPRRLASRDYQPRLAAFRAAFPWIPVWVWRRVQGRLEAQRLPSLAPSPPAV